MTEQEDLAQLLLSAWRQLGTERQVAQERGIGLVTWPTQPPAHFAICSRDHPLPQASPDCECVAVLPESAQSHEGVLGRALLSGDCGPWHTLTRQALYDWLEEIPLPLPERPALAQVPAQVIESVSASTVHHRLCLRCPRIARVARPGQFLHVWCLTPEQVTSFEQHKNRDLSGDAWPEPTVLPGLPLLRRPMSIHCVSSSSGESPLAPLPRALRERIERPCRDQVDLLIKLVGRGATELSKRQPGDMVDVIGPLGNPVPIRFDLRRALVVAGGIGLAPLLNLVEELCWLGIETRLLIGVRSRDHLPLAWGEEHPGAGRSIEQLESMGVQVTVVSEEECGIMVTAHLAAHHHHLLAWAEEVFACGPRPMLRQVSELVGDRLPCQVLLEERMACGVGACRSCVTKLHSSEPPGFIHRTVCQDGPCFPASEVIWQ